MAAARSMYLGLYKEAYKFEHCQPYLSISSKWNDMVNTRSETFTSEKQDKRHKGNSEPEFTGGASNDTPSSDTPLRSMRNINLGDNDVEIVSPNSTVQPPSENIFLNIGDGEVKHPGGRKAAKARARLSNASSAESNSSYSTYMEKVSATTLEELQIKKANLEWKKEMWERAEEAKRQRHEERIRQRSEERSRAAADALAKGRSSNHDGRCYYHQ
ncbi:hypothetical protein FRX31_017893 [Thalictrum thalictroides]|uniref:No apical meristem-associated C-terminal domain-containing protein n=1 Tax=Thalictrum thalictroides TaxID=46969 RepID=A0A7J6W575_THATH|nr:hypothetical protein FRX31_017893 [Thalictrum thalictroides]